MIIDGWDEVPVHRRPERGPHPGSQVQVLHRSRHSKQWGKSIHLPPTEGPFGILGRSHGGLRGDRHERAQLAAAALDPIEVVPDQFDRADLPAAHRRCLLQRGQIMKLSHGNRT